MRLVNAEGPPSRQRRQPSKKRKSRQAARSTHSLASTFAQGEAPADIVRRMQQAGAMFAMRSNPERTSWSFVYTVAPGGDAARCKQLFGKAEADSGFFPIFKVAVFVAIARAALDLPEGGR